MFVRLAYFLEQRLNASRRPGFDLNGTSGIDVYHASTLDHLEIFLETVLHRWPGARLRISSPLMGKGHSIPSDRLNDITNRYTIEWPSLNAMTNTGEPTEVTVLLCSPNATLPSESERAYRRAFTGHHSKRKLILHGDGSVWKGDFLSRFVRRLLREFVHRLSPRRDNWEQRRIDACLLADPGSIPRHQTACGHAERKRILALPYETDQCLECATVLKALPDERPDHGTTYPEEYHGVSIYDERTDWKRLLEEYQARRLRNMRKVGFLSRIGANGKPRILDVGCGTGGLASALANEGCDVLGIDCSRDAIEKAQTTFPQPRFLQLRFEDLHLLHEPPFDAVVLSHVLEHAREDGELLKGIRAVLVSEGFLYIEVPWLDPDAIRRRPFWYRLHDHYREYSKQGLARLVTGNDFEILAHEDSLGEDDQEPYQFLLARPDVRRDIEVPAHPPGPESAP